jgi:hypothetical protein
VTATDALTADLKGQVKILADDLRTRIEEAPARLADWKRIHQEAVTKDRTAMTWVDWREDRIDQAAVAWVLTTVFIRFCEDNSLVKPVWISGPKDRRQEALDAQLAYFREHPTHSDREWLLSAIHYLQNLPATRTLVDAHSALTYISPSGDAVSALLEFWQHRGDDGALTHDLHDESLSTRFLGDLYQDLSDYAKDKYALLQTPVFVEEHILDRTLEPALNDRPLDGFRMIDPTCGSGHFLLGAFARLLDRWHKHAPGMEIQAKVQSALDAIHGVDLNPFAVAVARFRLTMAALSACDLRSLEDAPAFKFHLAVGDSLIHGPDANVIPGLEARSAFMPFHYTTEDDQLLLEILDEGRYDAVIGNPPYKPPKDTALNKIYRAKFGRLCKGGYALSVPFMVQFFALAKAGSQSGWVGMITSNSFMDREFGVPLIEEFLARRDLRLIEDTSGAFIPGHGTPTVVVVGRNQTPASNVIHAVLGVQGEPGRPSNPAEGKVWSSIDQHVDDVNWEDQWITVSDLERKLFSRHPWSLGGGGAIDLKRQIEETGSRRLGAVSADIGFGAVTREDDAYMIGSSTLSRRKIHPQYQVDLVEGKAIREWGIDCREHSLWPYNPLTLAAESSPQIESVLWPYRFLLAERVAYGKTQIERDLEWFEYSMFFRARYGGRFTIAIPSVATNVHAALDRAKRVFKDTAVLVKLHTEATEQDHLSLIGLINSSTACFWLKQVCHDKGIRGEGGGFTASDWERFYQFNGSNIQELPLPQSFPLERSLLLDEFAQQMSALDPSAGRDEKPPTREALAAAHQKSAEARAHMISLQDELDWEVYWLYGFVDYDLTYARNDLPGLALGERAFEIALARSGKPTAWFERHGSTPITEVPEHWPAAYKELVQRRLDLIAEHPYIKLLEKPEYKRRWAQEPWEKRQERALRNWLLDRLEDRRFWFDSQGRPSPRSVAQLADDVTRDAVIVSVLALWEGRPDVPVSDSLTRLLADEAVPFHAGYRYKDSGARKRAAWEETWALQRREDAGEKVEIEVPPKYASADFAKASYWRHRGKLDVPKERFILYPDASRDGDGTPLLGWAGWDHAEQALALATIINDREDEGWPDERLVPLIAGLAELQPWVEQWHGDVHPDYGVSLAAFCAEQLATRAAQVSMTEEQLRRWRPEKKTRKGKGKS